MEIFDIILPSAWLSPFVKQYWTLKIDSKMQVSERVIPTGNIQLIFHRADRMLLNNGILQPPSFLSGQSIHYSDVSPSGDLDMLVVVFHPYGARPFFKLPMEKIYEGHISIEDIEDTDLRELQDKVLNASDNHVAIGYIESFFFQRLLDFDDYNYKRMTASLKEANNNTSIDVTSLAETSFLSEKQFQRIFSEYVGMAPKKFLRVLRFQHALYLLQRNPGLSLTQLSYEGGFYDQSHLIREFKSFSGYTPTEYLAACTPYSDYFSY